ncbi:MAG: hypothetical protein GC164_15665 [Phycisphaera sp.]|nr:hypothetical protein [Phycisphaera sp.]
MNLALSVIHVLAQTRTPGSPPARSWGGLENATDVFKPEYFNGNLLINPLHFVFGVTGVLLLVLAFWLRRRHQTRHERSAPIRIFHDVARQLGLSWPQQWLLFRIAKENHLPSPLALLLSGSTLNHYARLYAQNVTAYRRLKFLEEVRAIKHKLFIQPPTD